MYLCNAIAHLPWTLHGIHETRTIGSVCSGTLGWVRSLNFIQER
ncbi:MAG: hypothetical protein SPI24_09100 [Bacteroidales bacterium]|nr:hypothetical protein [Bacteroidales bacterium]MDY6075865.1 hypothetical protein [Bacteroidales bacterium]